MKVLRIAITVFLVSMVTSGLALSATIYVATSGSDVTGDGSEAEPYATIQKGIDQASPGDNVIVADGTYTGFGNKELNFKGKDIIVESRNGKELTEIDCEGSGRGFYLHQKETSAAVIRGFTIKNGSPDDGYGGGISCNDASPTIEDNLITENSANDDGGGISCTNSASPVIKANTITNNVATRDGGGIHLDSTSFVEIRNNIISENLGNRFGGGVHCRTSSSIVIDGNTISDNDTSYPHGGGGGIYYSSSSGEVEITNNTISGNSGRAQGGGIRITITGSAGGVIERNTINGNSTETDGGGIYCSQSGIQGLVIQGNEIFENIAGQDGGGIYCSKSTVQNNRIENNTAGTDGGGIYCERSVIQGNEIVKNIAGQDGGGIRCHNSSTSSTLENNLIFENSAEEYGGGICSSGSLVSLSKIINNTISKNQAISKPGGGIAGLDSSSAVSLNNILWGDIPNEIYIDSSSSIEVTYSDIQGGWPGEGNINVDPLFVDSPNDDYHLTDESPCISTGKFTLDVPTTDIEGNPRPGPSGSEPDMGAYENEKAKPPTLASIIPADRGQGATDQNIDIDGDNFWSGANVAFSGNGITVKSTTFVSSTRLTANIDVASDAAIGTRDVIITNPDTQTVTGNGMFTIGSAPQVTGVVPGQLPQGSENQDVVINGSGFVDNLSGDPNGQQLAIDFGTGITVNSLEFTSSTALGANISVGLNAAGNTRNVAVINGDAGVGVGNDVFEVLVIDDFTPPAAIDDLSASAGNSIDLEWNAPGDDGSNGTASEYIIRYNTEEITEANWDGSWDVDDEPPPSPAGTAESMTIDMPYPGLTYYFAIKTQDEVPNTSNISNSPSATENMAIHLYAGWNLVSFISPTMMLVGEAIESIIDKCVSVWKYDASVPRWQWYVAAAPEVSNLFEMGQGWGYWIQVTEDCIWDSDGGGVLSPSELAVQKPPFVLYGKIIEDGHTLTSSHGSSISAKVGSVEAASCVLDSDPLFKDFYFLIVPVDDVFHTGDIARIYVDGLPTEYDPITLGEMGAIRRYDMSYTHIPRTVRLLQNYPNPFNPETWLPYTLAQQTEVSIKIYNVKGQLIRTLDLGRKPAGLYVSKDKAAHWDGSGDSGESVASGVYFYRLEAGEFTAIKKMVVVE